MTNIIQFLKNNNLMADPVETKVLQPSSYNQNEVHFIKDKNKHYIFKIYRDGHDGEYHNELDNLSLFARALPTKRTPAIYFTGTINVDGVDKNYTIIEDLNGETLDTFLDRLNDKELENIANDIMKIFEMEEDLFVIPYKSDDSQTLIEKSMIKALNKLSIEWIRTLDFSTDMINKALELSKTGNEPFHMHLITQDLRARHLVYNKNKFVGIIDLEYAKLNDLALEMGHFLHDLLLLNTTNSKRLFCILRSKLALRYDSEVMNRIYLYMIKQGITNVASRMTRNIGLEIVLPEITRIKQYIIAKNIDDIL